MALRQSSEHPPLPTAGVTPHGLESGAAVKPTPNQDRILVGVSESSKAQDLLRYTERLAITFGSSWVAVNIVPPRGVSQAKMNQLTQNLTLARMLGAEVISTYGTDVASALLRIALEEKVTHMVLGKPTHPWWNRWFRPPSPVEHLIRTSGPIGIHLVQTEAHPPTPLAFPSPPDSTHQNWKDPLISLGIAGTITVFGLFIHDFAGYWSVALFYLLAVVVAATRLSRNSALMLSLVSALLWDVLFIPPRFTFSITQVSDVVMFFVFLVVTQVVVHTTGRLRDREHAERQGEERANALYRITRELATQSERSEAIRQILEEINLRFHSQSAVLLDPNRIPKPEPHATLSISAQELTVASYAFANRRPAGRFTDIMPEAEAFHLPLLSGHATEGVLVVKPTQPLSFAQRELLHAIGAQLAVFLEKERALLSAQNTKLAEQSDRLRKTLLDSVAHEFKTPLAVLSGALEQRDLNRSEMQAAVRRLTRTVNLLLKSTRLEEGQLTLQREWCEPDDLVQEALQLTETEGTRLTCRFDSNLPSLLCDVPLLAQSLSFIISNAIQHSPPEAPVEITVRAESGALVFEIHDRGPGLQEGQEYKIFEKFYRGTTSAPGGLGLGLSITRHLVEAHGGQVGALNRSGGGATVWIQLPVDHTPILPES